MYVPKIKSTIESIHFEWNVEKTDIENVHEFIKIFLNITDPHNKLATRIYEHTMRTIKIADNIMNKELADREVVIISLLLHDIGKTLCENSHNLVSYKIADLFLSQYYTNDTKKSKILDCILYHSAKDIHALDLIPEQKVIMDADILDEIGILLISRMCIKNPNRNCSIHEITEALEVKYSKVDKETKLLKTKYGSDLYCQKKKKFKDYIDQLKLETAEYTIML